MMGGAPQSVTSGASVPIEWWLAGLLARARRSARNEGAPDFSLSAVSRALNTSAR